MIWKAAVIAAVIAWAYFAAWPMLKAAVSGATKVTHVIIQKEE